MAFILLSKPKEQSLGPTLSVGDSAPDAPELAGSEPFQVVAFLRHVGCPFAEHMVKALRQWQGETQGVDVYIVSHSEYQETDAWMEAIGGKGQLNVICDPQRELYGKWGVGYCGAWHFLGVSSLLGVFRLLFKGIRNRKASGTRWQQAAIFLVRDNQIKWCFKPASAEQLQLPDLSRISVS